MTLNPKKVKSVWTITFENSAVTLTDDADQFHLYDDAGKLVMIDPSRMKLADHAFDHGADEIKHDYDLLKHR